MFSLVSFKTLSRALALFRNAALKSQASELDCPDRPRGCRRFRISASHGVLFYKMEIIISAISQDEKIM